MADQSDIVQVLVAVIAAAMYPLGTGAPSSTGLNVAVMGGWPSPAQLKALTDSAALVTVYPRPEERNTSHLSGGYAESQQAPGAAVTVNGQQVTVSGTPVAGEIITVYSANAVAVATYAVAAGDGPADIAAALAAKIDGSSADGAVLSLAVLPYAVTVQPMWTVARELRRQDKLFQITIWASCFSTRDTLAKEVDAALAAAYRLTISTYEKATSRFVRSEQSDDDEKQSVYRRDLFYSVEYPTTVQQRVPTATAPRVSLTTNQS